MKYYDINKIDLNENYFFKQFTKSDITKVCKLIDETKASLLTCNEYMIDWYLDALKTYENLLNNIIVEV